MRPTLLFVLLFAAPVFGAIQLDDSYEKVIAENGPPIGKAQAGDALILRYPHQTIRLQAGKVVAVENKPATPDTRRAAAPPPPPRARKPAPAPVPAPAATSVAWTTQYREALAAAKEQNRHVFLFFTGSDWCGWCMRLNREILSTPEFQKYAEDNLVLVEVDFPQAKPQSAELRQQNATLQRTFQIRGYPTVIILNADGKAVGRLGYQEGGPGPFLQQLKSL